MSKKLSKCSHCQGLCIGFMCLNFILKTSALFTFFLLLSALTEFVIQISTLNTKLFARIVFILQLQRGKVGCVRSKNYKLFAPCDIHLKEQLSKRHQHGGLLLQLYSLLREQLATTGDQQSEPSISERPPTHTPPTQPLTQAKPIVPDSDEFLSEKVDLNISEACKS